MKENQKRQDLSRGDQTKLLRIFYLKNDEVIDTEKDLVFDHLDNSVRITSSASRLFYSYRRSSRLKTLLIYDRDYNIYELRRRVC